LILRGVLTVSVCIGGLVPNALFAAPPAAKNIFESEILPILKENCIVCHGEKSPQNGLDLRSIETTLQGGASGPALRPGNAAQSLLISKIASGVMPPGDVRLSANEVDRIRVWIDRDLTTSESQNAKAESANVTERDILPIIQAGCLVCHGKHKQEAGLDLRTRESMLKGGKSGPAIVLGKPEESLIVKRLESREMPPLKLIHEASVKSPTEAQLDTLKQWIASGATPLPGRTITERQITAEDRAFWAFQPPRRPAIPGVKSKTLVRNEIDSFLLEKLEEKGLSYSPEADPLKLLRRLHLDLTGTPPSPTEIRAFLEDARPGAYEREADRLLASPEYGERWARHWLDLAGYSDSRGIGFLDKIRPNVWRYRDYVIRSLNSDKPYDQFLTEQIAGDELSDYSKEEVTQDLIDRLAATGFLRTTPDSTYEAEFAYIPERMTVVSNTVQVLGSAVMGITIGCARCHDHKYDPISQRDYYRFAAILQTAYDPYDWRVPKDRLLDIALDHERNRTAEHNEPIETEIKRLETAREELEKPYRERILNKRLGALPEEVRGDVEKLIHTPKDQRTEVQQYLARKFEDLLDVTTNQLIGAFDEFKEAVEPIQKEITGKTEQLKPKPQIRALTDTGGSPSRQYLLRRGEPLAPWDPVQPGVPAVFRAGFEPYQPAPPWPGSQSSGRRLALARWLTQPDHPLTARVIVNQIWMRRFGRGLVASPSNFGKSGTPPSHPELLDWLATELVQGGWSLKHIHRLMVTSTAYRQASRKDETVVAADPENLLLGRMPLRRMDAEQLYDSILKATGRLNPQRFGPPELVEVKESKEVVAKGTGRGFRRSVYVLQRRTTRVTLMDAYDLPHMTPNCLERRESTVSTQALHMMNSEQMWDHARHLAGRIIDEAGDDRRAQVGELFLRVLSRPPSEVEVEKSLDTLRELASHWPARLEKDAVISPVAWTSRWLALAGLTHTMLNTAEFAYID